MDRRGCLTCTFEGGGTTGDVRCAAMCQGGEDVVLDPSLKEAAAAAGALTVVATTHGEVCALHKPGGVGVSLSQVRACSGAAL